MREREGTAKYPGRVRNGKLLFVTRGFSVPLPAGPLVFAGFGGKNNFFNGKRRILRGSGTRLTVAGQILEWVDGILTEPEKNFCPENRDGFTGARNVTWTELFSGNRQTVVSKLSRFHQSGLGSVSNLAHAWDTILLEHIAHKDETRVYIGNCGNTFFVQSLK